MWGDIGPVRGLWLANLTAPGRKADRAIATFVAVAFVLLCLRAVFLGPWLLLDADLGWHVAYGDWIISNLRLPAVDEWSWTKSGQPYQLTQWGGEALLGMASKYGGSAGLLLVNCLTIAATLGVMLQVARSQLSTPLAVLVTATCGFMLFAGAVRPTMFSWLMAACMAQVISGFIDSRRKEFIGALCVLMAVWTNVHGSFALGAAASMAFLGCMAAVELAKGRQDVAKLCAAGIVGVAGSTLLNPYGWMVWDAVWTVANLETTKLRYFGDWKATELASGLALPSWLAIAGAACAVINRKSLWLILASGCVMALSLSAQRNAGLAAVGANLVLSFALARGWLDRRVEQEGVRWVSRAGWLRVIAGPAAISAGVWLMGSTSVERVARAQSHLYPLVCSQGLSTVGLPAAAGHQAAKVKLLNEFEHGGWWIGRGGNVAVSIDGRADLHGDQAFWDLETLKNGGRGWREVLGRMDPDAMCLNAGAKLFELLAGDPGYHLHSSDERWALWVRSQKR